MTDDKRHGAFACAPEAMSRGDDNVRKDFARRWDISREEKGE